ncbi:TetR/AcrR family transcriptional regulator [Actinocorallia populi]|uniref:TetR/AcrR family transcriptional regulator n=1 Tax=Actinocorallia populi TaxID=2079200 RepID=UPI0018E50190|nr:TetR/AcrR family transcriptional regulator [Actinocorallia populi]
MNDPLADQRPYATLLAKGEDRRQRILAVAQRLLTRNGWRNTTLGQIAREAGVTPAGLLHHFESKEQLLHAVLDARDAYDDASVDLSGDVIEQLERVAERFREAPELVGTFAVLRMENLDPGSPLHERFLKRHQLSLELTAECIRRGQRAGRYRTDLDPVAKAGEIVAFLNGIEATWLLDPSIPLAEMFREYTRSLASRLARPSPPP